MTWDLVKLLAVCAGVMIVAALPVGVACVRRRALSDVIMGAGFLAAVPVAALGVLLLSSPDSSHPWVDADGAVELLIGALALSTLSGGLMVARAAHWLTTALLGVGVAAMLAPLCPTVQIALGAGAGALVVCEALALVARQPIR